MLNTEPKVPEHLNQLAIHIVNDMAEFGHVHYLQKLLGDLLIEKLMDHQHMGLDQEEREEYQQFVWHLQYWISQAHHWQQQMTLELLPGFEQSQD